MGEDPKRDTRRRLSVSEAADALGVTVDAIRSRVKRETIDHEREGGRVYVLLGADQGRPGHDQPTGQGSDQSELVEALRDQILDLRRERDEWREQARVADRLLSAALERIPPQLEPPSEPRESPETVEEEPEEASPRPDRPGAQEATQRRPWWRRVLGR